MQKENVKKENIKKENVKKEQGIIYETPQHDSLVQEQPFYRKGMSRGEFEEEQAYLNRNLQSFYDGSYMPLWKQKWFL